MTYEYALNIYTDGSSRPKPRRGGIGIRYIYTNSSGVDVVENMPLPGYMGANSSEMELQACNLALENCSTYLQCHNFQKIVIFTDSKYVVDNYKNAMFLWPKTKWLRRGGAPVLNAELWKKLIRAMKKTGKRVEIEKVKGHSFDLHNRAVDRLAKQSATKPSNAPLAVRTVRRKKSTRMTRIGSVEMLGQRITIRIIEGQYLRPQRIYRYRYEVMSRSSSSYKNLDFACSKEALREGHTYSVRLNKDKANPQIDKVFREVLPKNRPT